MQPVNIVSVERAQTVENEVKKALGAVHKSFLKVGVLLQEAFDGGYHTALGMANFETWVRKIAGTSATTCFNYRRVVEMGNKLGITQKDMEKATYSHLLELTKIYREKPEEVKALIEKSAKKAIDLPAIKKEVSVLSGKEPAQKSDTPAAHTTLSTALALAEKLYGVSDRKILLDKICDFFIAAHAAKSAAA